MAVELELGFLTIPQAGLVELIEVGAAAGFDAITATPTLYRQAGLSDVALRARLRDAGVRVTYIDGFGGAFPGIPTGEAMAPYRSILGLDLTPAFTTPEEEFYRAAEALGAESINLMHFAGDPAVPSTVIVDVLGGICERATKRGFRILLEFLPDTGVGDIGAAADIAARTGAANLDVMLDTAHLTNSGGTAADVALHAARMGGIQINDLLPGGDDPGRLWPGDGDLPLAEMLGSVLRARPEVPVGVEVINPRLTSGPPAQVARRAAESARVVLARVQD